MAETGVEEDVGLKMNMKTFVNDGLGYALSLFPHNAALYAAADSS